MSSCLGKLFCSILNQRLYLYLLRQQYIDLAKAKSDDIYSLFKQNIKSCNAKRRRQRRRTVKNNSRSNWQKKQLCTCSTLFLYISLPLFARLQRKTSRNFLVTGFMEEISYVFSFTFFFYCRSFSPCIGRR